MAISASALRAAVAYNKRRVGAWTDNTFARNVFAFQLAYGHPLDVDGKLGPLTRNKVNEAAFSRGVLPSNAKIFALSIRDQLSARRADPAAARAAAARDEPAPAPPPRERRPAPRPPAGVVVREPKGHLSLMQSENAREANAMAAKEYGIKVEAPYTGPSDTRLATDVYAVQRAEAIDTHAPGVITEKVVKRLKQIAGKDVTGNPAAMRLSKGLSFPMSLMKIGGIALVVAAAAAFGYRRYAEGQTVVEEETEDLTVLSPGEYAVAEAQAEEAGVIPSPRANPYFDVDEFLAEDDDDDEDEGVAEYEEEALDAV